MNLAGGVSVSAAVQTRYSRKPEEGIGTDVLLARACRMAMESAGTSSDQIDGFGVASFTLGPDRAIDLAVKLALSPTWIMDSAVGGASGIDMLQHAVSAIRTGDARRILLVGGDVFSKESFAHLVRHYNRAMTSDYGDVAGFGPNVMFALITSRQMELHGLRREDYGTLVCKQRLGAATNPNAVYRKPLSMREYLEAPVVADPLSILDCVPVVSGACAVIVEADTLTTGSPRVIVQAVAAHHNFDLHGGDGTVTGLGSAARKLWSATGWSPSALSVLALYDDYPAVVIAQLMDLGILRDGHVASDLHALLNSDVALNSSGGMLSAGQCGAGAGLHFVVDAVNALRARNVGSKAVVSGYGMVASRYGACANAAALELVP